MLFADVTKLWRLKTDKDVSILEDDLTKIME